MTLLRRGAERAQTAVESVFRARGCHDVKVVRATKLGDAYDRSAFRVILEGAGDVTVCVAVVPAPNAPDVEEVLTREQRLLALLADRNLPFRVPAVYGVAADECGGLVLVRGHVSGVTLDQRMGWATHPPCETTARLAAQVHGIDGRELEAVRDAHPSRRAFAQHCLAIFERPPRQGADILARAGEWARAHLPTDGEPVLLHGDLMPQNILVDPRRQAPPALIDWEYACIADPAYELAVATRGVRRPFGIDRGLEKLVTCYRENGGADVRPADVHFYEAGLLARWVLDADDSMLDVSLSQLRAFLRRVSG